VGKFEGVIGLLLNGLEAESIARMAMPESALGRRPGMVVENEFNNRLIMPTSFWCSPKSEDRCVIEQCHDINTHAMTATGIDKNQAPSSGYGTKNMR